MHYNRDNLEGIRDKKFRGKGRGDEGFSGEPLEESNPLQIKGKASPHSHINKHIPTRF